MKVETLDRAGSSLGLESTFKFEKYSQNLVPGAGNIALFCNVEVYNTEIFLSSLIPESESFR